MFDTAAIADALSQRHAEGLAGDALEVLAPTHQKRLCLRLVINGQNGRKRWIFEGGISQPKKAKDRPASEALVMDFMDAYLGDWLADERSLRPTVDFSAHQFSGREFFLRGRRRDLQAERLAADLLNEPMEADLEELD
jgi:hypothetical protein